MIDPLPGDIFRRGQVLNNTYEIEGVLGRGGTGEVYRARNLISGRVVALKALNTAFSGREDYVELMKREEAMRDIMHDAVVRYTECSRTEDGHVILVMDFIDGPSMQALLERGGMDARELLVVAHRVAEGLVAAHGQGIVHRDLSPDNVILRDALAERATIIDFGIAKDTSAGARTIVGNDFAGKYEYAAPEQLEGRAEPRSDLYALGASVLAAYRGAVPFPGATPGEIVRRKQHRLDTEGVPEPLKSVIDWMADPDIAGRPASSRALLERLDELLLPQRKQVPRERRRGRGPWLAAAAVAMLAAGAFFYFWVVGPPGPAPLPLAKPYRLAASAVGDTARLSGNAPDTGEAAIIVAAFSDVTGSTVPDGSLTLAEGVPSAQWPAGVAALIGHLQGLEDWSLDVHDSRATVTGTAPNREVRQRVEALLRESAASSAIEVTLALRTGPVELPVESVAEIVAGFADCGPLAPVAGASDHFALGETVMVTGAVAEASTAEALKTALEEKVGDRAVSLNVAVLNQPICTVRAALPQAPADGLSIWLGNGAIGTVNPAGVFHPGDNPIAELHLPADRTEGFLWVVAVDTTGNVFNLLPNLSQPENRVAAVGEAQGGIRRVRVLHTLADFAADNRKLAMQVSETDFGKSEIVAILSHRPLLALRPKTESAAAFAEALEASLAADPTSVVAVASRVLDTRP